MVGRVPLACFQYLLFDFFDFLLDFGDLLVPTPAFFSDLLDFAIGVLPVEIEVFVEAVQIGAHLRHFLHYFNELAAGVGLKTATFNFFLHLSDLALEVVEIELSENLLDLLLHGLNPFLVFYNLVELSLLNG